VNRTLTRSRNSMIGGVAAGVAEWIKADAALVRIAWALLVPITSGAALLAYIVAWVVIPEATDSSVAGAVDDASADASAPTAPLRSFDEGRTAQLLGGGLILVGIWFLLREYVPEIDWGLIWPLILVAAGIAILVGANRRR